jgi:hypothetical protein
MSQNLNISETAQAWADITIKEFLSKIHRMKIGDSGTLARSLENHVRSAANGDLQKIQFAFQYYGTFVDMGVGKGTNLTQVKENSTTRRLEGRRTGNRRRAKKWYSKTIESEVFKLSRILAEKYGVKGFNAINDELPKRVNINL